MALNRTGANRPHAADGKMENETIQRDNQPTTGYAGPESTRRPRADGISNAIPCTNNTKAPGQWGTS